MNIRARRPAEFVWLDNAVVDEYIFEGKISSSATRLYLIIARLADSGGYCPLDAQQLIEGMKISRTTLDRAAKELTDAKLLIIEPGRRGQFNRYAPRQVA